MKQHPSTKERIVLRTFIRGHADALPLLKGRKVNDLTMEELRAMSKTLGGDAVIGDVRAEAAAADAAADQDNDQDDDQDDQDADQDKQTDKQLAAIRELIVNGGFNAADPALRKLIADANKPAEIQEVQVFAPGTAPSVTHAKQTTIDVPWNKVFGVKGAVGKRTSRLWDGAHPDTPAKDDNYVWPQPATGIALTQLARGNNVFLHGPAGTGKTAWAMQLAASLGRPFALISCDDQTDAPTLLGMTVPSQEGGIKWQDGALTRAIQTPGCVICIDEPSVARAGAMMVFQNVLAYRTLYIAETGQRIKVAPGVVFIACDNTNGTGGGASRGFTGTGRLNSAFLDRFGVFCHVTYLEDKDEARVIMRKTGCTKELAMLLISAATTTRTKAEEGTITNGLGLRRLFAWAQALTDGIAPRDAFEAAILNCLPDQDRQAVNQQCLLTYDKAAVARALDPQAAAAEPENANPTDAGRAAAEEFAA